MTAEQRKNLRNTGFEDQEAERYEEILNFSSEIEYDEEYDMYDEEFRRKRKEEEEKLKNQDNKVKREVYPDINAKEDSLQTPFQQFLTEHTVKLPDSQSNRFKLLKNMQAKSYFELNAKELGLSTVVILNEERRKYKKLPPLTPLDYNCIDKAALKIRTVLDTLWIVRKI